MSLTERREALNGIPATTRHDEGAIARCSYCGRYTLNPAALGGRAGVGCECGRVDGWSGSFVPPDPSAQWSGPPDAVRTAGPNDATGAPNVLEGNRDG